MKARANKSTENTNHTHDISQAPKREVTEASEHFTVGLVDNRPEAMAQRKQVEAMNQSPRVAAQRAVNDRIHHSPYQGAQHQRLRGLSGKPTQLEGVLEGGELLQGKFDSAQLRSHNVVQRQILLDGKAPDIGDLLKQANDVKERVIIANWDWSDTVHNFTSSKTVSAQEKLSKAVATAKSQVVDVPPLYSASNLKFLTDAGNRLPTLYFVSGNNSGRIRQQHGSGPAVIAQTNKVDYFFPSKDKAELFQAVAMKARKKDADFNPNLSDYEATLTPTSGYNHFEVTYAGQKVKKLHLSGGTIDVNIGGYDETRIKAIYQRAIGHTT